MSEKPIHIFGLGQCSLDYIGAIASYPPPDVKCEFSGLVIQGGGPVATALVALARWGLSCYFAGVVGDDSFGGLIRESLADEGIDTGGMVTRKGFASQFAFIAAEAESPRRTIFWQRPTGPFLSPEEIDRNILHRAKVLHTDGLCIDAALHACRIARDRNIPVVVDAGTLRDGMRELAALSDCFISSELFARQLTGGDDPLDACRIISEMGPAVAAVTLGAKGYVALADGDIIRKPAYPVAAVDTTGCGDVFHAGFIFGFLQQWTIERSLDLGAWAAARVSLRMGGRAGIPPLTELQERG